MKRARRIAKLRFRTKLQIELLESRRLLASDLTNPILIEGREAVRNELLVQYAPQVLGSQRNAAAIAASVTVAETIHTSVMQANRTGVLERVTLNPGVDMQTAMQALKKNPNVLYVEPNYIYRPSVVSNDTQYTNGSLWGMYSNDSPNTVGPNGTTNQFGSQAEKAWNDNIIGNSNVYIGVIDEGNQFDHPDLIDNMWLNPFDPPDGLDNDNNGFIDDVRGWDFANGDNTIYDGTSDDHGTHCAGTIGAKGGNGTGVAGVAWNVTMIPIKFLGTNGGTTANAVKAVDYATDLKNRHGINIVATSNSWGGGGFSQSLLDAITRGANKNILFVAAAGNGGADSIGDDNDTVVNYPSNYDTTAGAGYDAVIAVASITSSGAISGFSNFGDVTVDLGAPGSGIVSTVPVNAYANYSGTSMATPHVSGAIALYASTQPAGISALSIRQALLQSTKPTASLAGKTVTGGRLDVYELVRAKFGIQVSAPTPSAITTEAGGAVSFTVVLSSAPTANVTIPISSNDTTEGIVSTNSLVFTATNWNTPQTVTVTGVDDSLVDGNINYTIIIGAATSSDTNYNGLNPNDINLTNTDNDTPGITVSAPSSTSTTEAGGIVTFTVRLDSQPSGDVSISVSSSDTTEGTVSTSSLLFTATNWNTAQTVTVNGIDDFIADGNIAYTIILGAAVSSDLGYDGRNPNDINLTNQDNDTAGITVSSPSGTNTTEAGSFVTFTVRLTSEPTANVSVAVSSSDTTEGAVSTSSLLFTAANWNTPQTITVTGVNDAVDDGNIIYTVILGAAVSNDPGYNGRNPNDVSLTNIDDDTAGITVSAPSGTTTTEAGGSVTFTIRLNSEPTANVSIALSSSDTTEGTVSVSSVSFTAANWSTAQTITVRGVDDTIADGNIVYTVLIWAASSSDTLYNGINPADINLTNLDNEPIPTKFFVVNDAATNRTYEYDAGGGAIENYLLTTANTTPRGVATNVAGDRVWVVDSNRTVYVYNNSGVLLGSWMAGSMPSNAVVEGITTNGTHIWIVESGGDRVYYYPNAAMRTSGTQNATSNFLLNGSNRNPKDLVTDGSFIWVVNDSTSDRVFRYSTAGTLQNSWAINTANSLPTGITLDPSNGSQDIWIVDSGTDRVYRYANARTLTAPTLTSFFQLSSGNTDPAGIADPPASEAMSQFEVFVDGSSDLSIIAPLSAAWSSTQRQNAQATDSAFAKKEEILSSNSRDSLDLNTLAPDLVSRDARVALMFAGIDETKAMNNSRHRATRSKATADEIRDRIFAEIVKLRI